jgi:hypothetical protein
VQRTWPEAARPDLTVHHLHGLARALAVVPMDLADRGPLMF